LGAVVALALLVLSLNEGQRRQRIVAPQTILYDATTADGPLVAHAHRMQGRPARVERAADGVITVSVDRVGTPAAVATPVEVLWLTAEALVAEEALGVTVSNGTLRHADRDLTVPITPALRALTLHALSELRASEAQGPRISRQDPQTCRGCGYRAMCAIGRINAPTPHSAMG
ncbi:MAG: hypothetical protein H0X24_09470, partial [Ktedonobacterales bacterium]|nr:hypothetical protein [Ktedonobacterales bacterium]